MSCAPEKLAAVGYGTWDDGSDYDGVKKICVRTNSNGIQYVKFYYVKDEQEKEGATHGSADIDSRGSTREIVINHPEEYLVCVQGWYNKDGIIQGIKFTTNQRSPDHFGSDKHGDDTEFTPLQVEGKKIIGFHGSAGSYLNLIGAYLAPVPPPKNMLLAIGGNGGTSWNDGVFDGVKKVYVGQGENGISMVQFVYAKEAQDDVIGKVHGQRTLIKPDTFVLGPDEYITEVHGSYDKIHGHTAEVMIMLKFKTNKRTSEPFGLEAGDEFTLKKDGHKIVGFHGSASDILHKIGVHVLPISN